jgi:fatty-acyl-CoA synthase
LIAPPQERRDALEARYPRWQPRTIAGALDHSAQAHPERPLVIGDDQTLSYSEIQDWSRRLAAGLLATGVRPGDHVAVLLANFPSFVALKYAIARVGAAAVPINFMLRRAELEYILRQSRARALITMDSFRDHDHLADLDGIIPGWREHAGGEALPDLRRVFVAPTAGGAGIGSAATLDDLALEGREGLAAVSALEQTADPTAISDVIYTSGTTGSPKGVLLTHDMVVRTAYSSAYVRAFEDGRRIHFALPMYHVFGYIECLIAATLVGGSIVPHTQFSPDAALDAIERHQASEIVCVPLMTLQMIEAAGTQSRDLSSLVSVFSSGGASPPEIWQGIRDVFGAPEVMTAYGMSETTASTCCTRPEDPDARLLTSNGQLKLAGVAGDPALGGVLALYKTRDPETGADLAPGLPGELMAFGPIVTPGYFDKPEETAEAFTDDGWLHTGDVGIIDADGFLTLTGRIKETYRCGGEMVMPREIELVLGAHPAVREAHVVGVPHPRMGEVGCACVVLVDTANVPDPEELIELCSSQLARFKVPRHVVFMLEQELPRTATGRVQKFKLVEQIRNELAADPRSGQPTASASHLSSTKS